MRIVSNEKRLRLLLVLGGLIILTIICVLTFGFDVSVDKKQEKIALVLLAGAKAEEWDSAQYNNMKDACFEVGAMFLSRRNATENAVKFKDTIGELNSEGVRMIFIATPTYALPREYFAEEYPNISFATNTADYKEKNLTPYMVRMYQGLYLAGALAGMRTQTNVAGYVASMSDSLTNLEINAFALGLQRTNPNAKVVVMWTGDWQNESIEAENTKRLVNEMNADVITYIQNDKTVANTAEALGVDFIGYNETLTGYSPHNLTSVTCRWDIYYRNIIDKYLKGDLNRDGDHWMDIKSGVVVLSNFSTLVTPEMQSRIEELRKELIDGCNIFTGNIYDNEGVQRCVDGETISDKTLLFRMNWLVRGVEVHE